MNKWENNIKKQLDNANECMCSTDRGLYVPNRQLSFIVAGLLFLFFATFMAGYFYGKKNVVAQLGEKAQQELFADQVYSSMLINQKEDMQPISESVLITDAIDLSESIPLDVETKFEQIAVNEKAELCEQISKIAPAGYYAQLIGFGTEKAAHSFVQKLSKKGIDTEVKKRSSKTAKGNISYWYQVVTTVYTDKNRLTELVERIAKEENIKDATIAVC
jgi:hypothetical protein